jgi:hypothetical protein
VLVTEWEQQDLFAPKPKPGPSTQTTGAGLVCFWCYGDIAVQPKASQEKRRELAKEHEAECECAPLRYALKRDRLSSAYLRRAIAVLRTVDTPEAAELLDDIAADVWPPCEPAHGDEREIQETRDNTLRRLDETTRLLSRCCDIHETPTPSTERATHYARVRAHLGRKEP